MKPNDTIDLYCDGFNVTPDLTPAHAVSTADLSVPRVGVKYMLGGGYVLILRSARKEGRTRQAIFTISIEPFFVNMVHLKTSEIALISQEQLLEGHIASHMEDPTGPCHTFSWVDPYTRIKMNSCHHTIKYSFQVSVVVRPHRGCERVTKSPLILQRGNFITKDVRGWVEGFVC
eukprot:sb/3472013/